MAPISTWIEDSSRALSPRLQRLRQALDALVNNLREDVALAVGRAVAEAVRAALRQWFGCDRCADESGAVGGWHASRSAVPARRPGEPGHYGWQAPSSATMWGEPEARDYPRWSEDEEEELDERPYLSQEAIMPPAGAKARMWTQAVALACQAAAWCLRSRPRPLAVVAFLGLAALTVLTIGVAGHLILPIAGMSGPVLTLLRLSDLLTALGRVLC